MSTNITSTKPRSLDEFEDWTDEVESGEEQVSERSIVGQRVRFGNDGKWRLLGQTELTKPLIVVNVRRSVIKWNKDKKKPPETTFLKAGEKIPDLKKRNEETPKSEWVTGFDGNPKGPWEAQHIVYLIDPISIDPYTYLTSTIGGGIAVRDLIDRIMWMRQFKGNRVYPVVELTTRVMSIQKGTATRSRPHFEIVKWAGLSPTDDKLIPANDARQLPPQQPTERPAEVATNKSEESEKAEKLKAALHAIDMQTVEPPSLKEETGDEIKF
jgi:hypothetical protein